MNEQVREQATYFQRFAPLLVWLTHRVAELQSVRVSGRWRAMSRIHLKAYLGDEQECQSWGEAGLAKQLTVILLI